MAERDVDVHYLIKMLPSPHPSKDSDDPEPHNLPCRSRGKPDHFACYHGARCTYYRI
jgi:hypothetical protein